MANKTFLSGMLITMLAFGVMGIAHAEEGGTFTITDIPSRFNGMYVVIEGEVGRNIELVGAQTITVMTFVTGPMAGITQAGANIGARISNGRVRMPVWIMDGAVRFTGSLTAGYIDAIIFDSPSSLEGREIALIGFDSVVFSNGNATVSFHDNTDFLED